MRKKKLESESLKRELRSMADTAKENGRRLEQTGTDVSFSSP